MNTNKKLYIYSILIMSSFMALHPENNRSLMAPHVTTNISEKNMMHGMYGRYPMTREASGTSWVPDSSPPEGIHLMRSHHWNLMISGFSYLVADAQGGKRGGKKLFDENMLMIMAQKNFDSGIIGFRTMFSAEPFTVGKCGYPLLLQTGETCDGKTPLVDRQHPHDLIDELALVFTYAPSDNMSCFLYTALPGEPALGPPTYFMRFSSEYIPETPLGHHWMDSTHITFGVLTAGFVYKNFKLEASSFKGREPDEHRYDIEKPKLDSYSFRISFNPTDNIALQLSYGFLKSPEQLHPDTNTKRVTLSAIYNKHFDKNSNVQATAVLGINKNIPGNTLPAFLIEATTELRTKHIIFSRFEILRNDDLFDEPSPLAGEIFTIEKLTLGYIYEFIPIPHLKWGIGGLIDFPIVPHRIKRFYGNTISGMACFQMRLI